MTTTYNAPAAAATYDAARELPAQTKALWKDAIRSAVPGEVSRILDLGCGTGRFTVLLQETFGCPVVGVEPSAAMLDVARSADHSGDIEWRQGDAEQIPLADSAVDLVFMSQVFHHLADLPAALREIRRVLAPGGTLAIRNGTRENNLELEWLHCFPEALAIERKREFSQQALEDAVCEQGFAVDSRDTIHQLFAASYQEYYNKISHRGLSSLISISDEAFEAGLGRLREWVTRQPLDEVVYEPVDLFVFKKV